MLATYYPEMKQAKPAAEYEASLAYYGRHYFVDTRKEMKGRGITFVSTATAETLVPEAQHKIGTHTYRLTEAAFKALCAAETVSMQSLL